MKEVETTSYDRNELAPAAGRVSSHIKKYRNGKAKSDNLNTKPQLTG